MAGYRLSGDISQIMVICEKNPHIMIGFARKKTPFW